MVFNLTKKIKTIFFSLIFIFIFFLAFFYYKHLFFNPYFFIPLIIFFFLLIYIFFFYYRNILFGPAVLFEKDNNIKIGLWPNNKKVAFVFTIDDINATTEISDLRKIINLLDKYNVKSTLFIVPFYSNTYKIKKESLLSLYLKKQEKRGNEIAQHGLTHVSRRKSLLIKNNFKEFLDYPYSQQRKKIILGLDILNNANFKIDGFRAPAFGIDKKTLKILDEEKFLYDSSIRISPWILMNNKRVAESLFYPFHINELSLLEIITNGDFFWETKVPVFERNRYKILVKRFNEYYDKEGAFILLSHIQKIMKEKNFNLLEKFLQYQKDKEVWRTTLREIAMWWLIREDIYAETSIKNKTLKIKLETSFDKEKIKGLTIDILNNNVEEYEIYLNNALIKKGSVDLNNRKIII
ncbi:MAG: DUF2334 domain-containing protein [Candidatus Pacearchaeota archaeon]